MTNRELYNNIARITSSIREKRMRFAGYCWRSKHQLVSERSRGRPAKTFVDQMVENTECEVEELINVMESINKWKKRVLRIPSKLDLVR